MTARHILTFAQTPLRGGVERAQLRLVRAWAAAGRRVTMVMGDAGADFPVPPGVDLVELGTAHFLELRRLASIVRRCAPDLVFCPGNHYSAAAAFLRLRLGAACPPIVAKLSNTPARGDHGPALHGLHAAWLRTHGLFLDRLVAMTPATAAAAERALAMRERVGVIPNPPALALPGAQRVPLPSGRFLLGVGRLVRQKRWDRLVDALPRLSDPEIGLVLLGEGPERRALMARARALGVAHRVHLPGQAACPFPAMTRAALVALPSDYEGVPGVLREALSVGTPVIATGSSPAIREIVTCPSLGSVVPLGDASALANTLNHWLRPDAKRPAPVPQPGADAAERYLALFDDVALRRRVRAPARPGETIGPGALQPLGDYGATAR